MNVEWQATGNPLPESFDGEVTERLQSYNDRIIGTTELQKSLPIDCRACGHAIVSISVLVDEVMKGESTTHDAIRSASVQFQACSGPIHNPNLADARPGCPIESNNKSYDNI